MQQQVMDELHTALQHALEERAAAGLANPENIRLDADWLPSHRTVETNPMQNQVTYNLRILLRDAHRLIPDEQVKRHAHAALHQQADREQAAIHVLQYWHDRYHEEPEHAVTVSTLFHAVEQLLFQNIVAVNDSFLHRFAVDAVPTAVRDPLYRGLLPEETGVKLRQKLAGKLQRETNNTGDLPDTAVYENCLTLVNSLVAAAENPVTLHETYPGLDTVEDVFS